MLKSMFFQNFVNRFSPMLWMVAVIHLIWGYLFITKGLPDGCPFPGAFPFYHHEMSTQVWGYTLIIVSLISILGTFVKSTSLSFMSVIPQQLVAMYGVMAFVIYGIHGDDVSLLLAAGWFIPATIFHTVALFQMHMNERAREIHRVVIEAEN